MAVIPIEIISDVICPWCYIGYRTLQRTIALYKKTYPGGSNDEFRIVWKPYFIDLVEPEGSVLIYGKRSHVSYIYYVCLETEEVNPTMRSIDRMARRMTAAQIDAAQTRIKREGRAVGIDFQFGGSMGSSRLAHRALYFAISSETGGSEIQCRLAENLFRAQFELEKDVSHPDVAVESAVNAGLDEDNVKAFLEGGCGVKEVEIEQREVREMGVQGVPLFKIGEESLDGAAGMEEFFEAFVKARGRGSVAGIA
ncbi:DsbA family oxidoreductase [Aspergillus undulatus]|uniref:DsbA family oxidoreductase n=1 Tax=Aspergillus undulatus TaxID=1810928 RepID=UPI003CCD1824